MANTSVSVSQLTAYTTLHLDDLILVIDVHDTSMAPTGTDKRATIAQVLAGFSGGVGTGTVSATSVVTANGFAGTVANNTTTPAITISTAVAGMLKGSGGALVAAVAGTDYLTAVATANLAAAAVTYPKMQAVAPSRLLGNPSGASGSPAEIALGTGLAFSGGNLVATAAGVPSIANNTLLANVSGGSAVAAQTTVTAMLDAALGTTPGMVPTRGASAWSGAVPPPGLPAIANNTLMANVSGGSAAAAQTTMTAMLDAALGTTPGMVPTRGASAWSGAVQTYTTLSALFDSVFGTTPGLVPTRGASVWDGALPAGGLPSIPGHTMLANAGGSTAAASATSMSAMLDASFGATRGGLMARGAAAWQYLAPGAAGQVLTSGGAGADLTWTTPTSGGAESTIVAESSVSTATTAAWGTNYVATGTSSFTITLPSAVGNTGNQIRIRCDPAFTGLLTVASTSGQHIGVGTATSRVLLAGETANLQSDGANVARTYGVLIPASARMRMAAGSPTLVSMTIVPFDTVVFDNTSALAVPMANVSGNSFIVPRAGIYAIRGRLCLNWPTATASTDIELHIFKGSTDTHTLSIGYMPSSTSTGNVVIQFNQDMILAAGDVITLRSVVSGTGMSITSDAATDYTAMSMTELVGW
ncbi:unnamed protein product [uncultured bacterium]|nr:unnamed protein product [uncultured bacterium]